MRRLVPYVYPFLMRSSLYTRTEGAASSALEGWAGLSYDAGEKNLRSESILTIIVCQQFFHFF